MNILLTGVTSATGCAIACALQRHGHAVIGTHQRKLSDYPPWQQPRLLQLRTAGVTLTPLDLAIPDALATMVRKTGTTICIHHAGHTAANSAAQYDRAQGDALHIAPLPALYAALESIPSAGVVLTGTAAEYGVGTVPWNESADCTPHLPYGQSKLAATQLAAQLAERHGVPTRVARLFMPYGPGMNPTTLVAQALRSLATRTPLALSSCRSIRDFVHIADIATAYTHLVDDCTRAARFDIFNIASGIGTTVRNFLEQLAATHNVAPCWQFDQRPERPDDPPIVVGDARKAHKYLPWAARPLQSGLQDLLS